MEDSAAVKSCEFRKNGEYLSSRECIMLESDTHRAHFRVVAFLTQLGRAKSLSEKILRFEMHVDASRVVELELVRLRFEDLLRPPRLEGRVRTQVPEIEERGQRHRHVVLEVLSSLLRIRLSAAKREYCRHAMSKVLCEHFAMI